MLISHPLTYATKYPPTQVNKVCKNYGTFSPTAFETESDSYATLVANVFGLIVSNQPISWFTKVLK